MTRTVRDIPLQTREARRRLRRRKRPYYREIEQGLAIGYRPPRKVGIAGDWQQRRYVGNGKYDLKHVGKADDFADADGIVVLNFKQAQQQVQKLAQGNPRSDGEDRRTITVSVALDRYQVDCKARGADIANVARVRTHLSKTLAERPVALLTGKTLTSWKNGLLAAPMTRPSADRVCNAFRAALNLVADQSEGAQSRAAWEIGLKAFGGSADERHRNVILPDADVLRIVSEAAKESKEFGLFVETIASTGARPIQLSRTRVRDLHRDFVEMPSSRKGKREKKILYRRVPISLALATRLRKAATAAEKNEDAFLFTKPSGEPWGKSDHSRLFSRTVQRADLDPKVVTIYALRHSSITRQLKANVPIRVVAVLHDTSVPMIERNYSVEIDKHVDDIVRPALLNTETPLAPNVVSISGPRS
jgi:Phage integrase family